MALDKAHEGYEYQDLLTVYFILKEILDETDSKFTVDRKECGADKLDDLLIRNKKGNFKRQIKYSGNSTNHTFTKDNISAGSTYNLSLDSLYHGWLNHPEKDNTEFRLCLAWNEPVDELANFLEAVSGKQTFPDFSTKVFKIKGDSIWPISKEPLNTWRNFKKASATIDRKTFLKFCNLLLIEVAFPKFSLNLNNPGDLEQLVIIQVQKTGVGVFPNNHLRPVEFILHLLAIVKRARSKGTTITIPSIFHELNIITDFGKIEQRFPIIESENLNQKKTAEKFIKEIQPFQKVLLIGEPGSGKSWFIENLQKLLKENGVKVIRHYCYTHLDDSLQKERIKLNTFYGNLIYDIIQAYPILKKLKHEKFASTLSELNLLLENIKEPTCLIVDGLDHIDRIFHFRQFTDITPNDIAIISSIQKLKIYSNVKIIVASQNIPVLNEFNDFKKIIIPEWQEKDVKNFLLKLKINNEILVTGETLSNFLFKKSSGNPLYIKYLLDELMRQPNNIQQLPAYSFNLTLYYQYLLSQLNEREDVAQVLAGVNFRLNKTDLEEITGSGNYVSISIAILNPVLKPNLSQSGYIIYHESFRRFIIEQLKANSVSVEDKVFNPVIKWFSSKDFFSHRKTYRYSLSFLFESGKFKEMLHLLHYTFITESVVNGQSWELIERNYRYFVKAACNLRDFASIILLNEIDKILCTAKDNFLELFPLYIEALGKIFGFQYVSEYLVFEGTPSFTIEEGLKACYVCDENNIPAPWELYLKPFPKKISKEYFSFYIRGLLALKKEKTLDSLATKIRKRSLKDFEEIFKEEFLKYNPADYVASLANRYISIELVVSETIVQDPPNRNELLLIAEEILKFENIFSNELIILENFLSGIKSINSEALSIELIDKFKGKNWFYNWLIYYMKVILLSHNDITPYFKIKEAFEYLQYAIDPFRGKPRTCDLYSAHPLIYQSFKEGLRLIVLPEQWKDIIDILVKVSNGTTTSLQRSIAGPLATDTLFKLLSEFACVNNLSYVKNIFEELSKEKEEYHLHRDIAEYSFRLASLFSSANEKNKALKYLKKGVEYSLGYTMRKDLTLLDAISGVEFYALIDPNQALEDLKTVRILVDSAVDHTDGKETNHFPNMWFEGFLRMDFHKAALFLLHELSISRYDWRAEKSLVDLLCDANGKIDPIVEFYLAMTFPINDSEKFINYCLNLNEILEVIQPAFAKKLMARIIPFSQPRQNKNLSNNLIERVNKKIYSGGYDKSYQVLKEKKYDAPSKKKTFEEGICTRKEFSFMSEAELITYFEEKGVLEKDINSLIFLFYQFHELTEPLKQVIQTIITKNNQSYSDKIQIDIIFSTQNDIECYYWICRFMYDVGGYFQKFVNEIAFNKAHSINSKKAFDYLWELLPSQLDIGFNFDFSANLIKVLIQEGYDKAVITLMWNNLLEISSYRLPVKEEIDWDAILANELGMNEDEIFIAIIISRYKAATTERFQWTTSALHYLFEHKHDKLIKPLKWFFANQSKFLDSVLVIILQLLLKQQENGSWYHQNFKSELQTIFPRHHFLIDSIITKLLNIPMPILAIPEGIIYSAIKNEEYDFFVRLNKRFRPMESCGINLKNVFAKYIASFRSKYEEYFKLYWNKSLEYNVSHVYPSNYILKLINTELYEELNTWKKVEYEPIFNYASLIDVDSIVSAVNSFSLRPVDLPKPYELKEPYTKIERIKRGDWVRLGHYEFAFQQESARRGSSFKSFGGIIFSNAKSNLLPYSNYSTYPFLIWNNLDVKFEIEKEIVFAFLQEDSLEFYKILWLNPDLVELLKLKVKNGESGLIAVNATNETILRMSTWSCNYVGDDYLSSLSYEIPRLQGTDLIIRADYFDKLCGYFTEIPTYHIVKQEFTKE